MQKTPSEFYHPFHSRHFLHLIVLFRQKFFTNQPMSNRRKPRYSNFFHVTPKPFRFHLRNFRSSPSTWLCVTALLFVLYSQPFLHIHSPHHLSIIGKTTALSPILSLPAPYGISRPIMSSVLTYVRQYIQGASRVDQITLKDTIDSAHMHGHFIAHDPKTGQPAWTPTPFDFYTETYEMKILAHTNTSFNKVRSDSLPLDRPLPEYRPKSCKFQWYYNTNISLPQSPSALSEALSALGILNRPNHISSTLLDTSVIIIFYNELLSAILRSIHSVLNRTPPHLLHEIILVDDGSDHAAPWFKEGAEFERHLQLLPKTRLARLQGRNGLMRARNVGASLATGDTITFLDSHVEVAAGWLQPLVGRIAEGLQTGVDRVVVPVIDNIDSDTFQYEKGGLDVLGHSWGLYQVAIDMEYDINNPSPIRSPIMAGGIFSMSRKYFDKLGFYDPEMKIWGGEELELSFRIWLCGGTLECLPCSRVGHVFRSSKYWEKAVFNVPGEVIARNKLRASYWMGDYAKLAALAQMPLDTNSVGSTKRYDEIRKRLQCKPYRWYLENVYPQMLETANILMPNGRNMTREFIAHGYLQNKKTKSCLDDMHNRNDGAEYGVFPCHFLRGSQSLAYTHSKQILSGDLLLNGCLTREDDVRIVKRKCTESLKEQQTWNMIVPEEGNNDGLQVVWGNMCLTIVVSENQTKGRDALYLEMARCNNSLRQFQDWAWEVMPKGLSSLKVSNSYGLWE